MPAATLVAKLDGAPVYTTPEAPLTRRRKDGTEAPALCWSVGGLILVHPERWDAFCAAFGEDVERVE